MRALVLAGALLLPHGVAAQSSQPANQVAGVVVDENGWPAPGVTIWARAGQQLLAAAVTDQDGRFRIAVRQPPAGTVQLMTDDPGAYEPFEPTAPCAWGADNLRIPVRRALSFVLRVVDHETGQPIEEFAVKCHLPRTSTARQREPRLAGRHEGGMVVVDRVRRGVNRLVVIPKDPGFAESQEILIDAAAPPLAPVRVEVKRTTRLSVRVVDRSGQPVPGSTVELVDPAGHSFDALTRVLSPDPQADAGRAPAPMILGSATTDRLGRARLTLPAEPEGLLAIRVRGKGHASFVVRGIRADQGQPMLELVTPRPARLLGMVTPAELATLRDLRLVLRSPGDRFGPEQARKILLAPDGTFALENLPSLEAELLLELRLGVKRKGGGMFENHALNVLTRPVTLREGETATVVLDAAQCRPGPLRARVLDQDRPARGALSFALTSAAIGGSASIGEFELDDDGRIELRAALPGTYRASLRVAETKVVQLEGEFTLAPGKPAEWTFRLPAEK